MKPAHGHARAVRSGDPLGWGLGGREGPLGRSLQSRVLWRPGCPQNHCPLKGLGLLFCPGPGHGAAGGEGPEQHQGAPEPRGCCAPSPGVRGLRDAPHRSVPVGQQLRPQSTWQTPRTMGERGRWTELGFIIWIKGRDGIVGEFEAWTATDGCLSNVAGMGDKGEARGRRQVMGTS